MSQLWMRNAKHKKKPAPNLEFVSPYPLEDCVWQLQNFPGVGEWFPVKTRVELAQVDEVTWAFTIVKSYSSLGFLEPRKNSRSRSQGGGLGYPKVLVEGQLRGTDSETTLVVGTVSVRRKLSLISLLLAGIFIIVLLSGALPVFNAAPLLIILIIVVFSISIVLHSFWGPSDYDQRFANAMKGHIKGVLGN